MDKINSKTKIVNRFLYVSSFIYKVENLRTLAEINKTTQEKINPFLSAIKTKDRGLAPVDEITHSIRNIELDIST